MKCTVFELVDMEQTDGRIDAAPLNAPLGITRAGAWASMGIFSQGGAVTRRHGERRTRAVGFCVRRGP